MLREISIHYYYTKKFTLYLIIVIHLICVCIVHKNRIAPHFYASFHIKDTHREKAPSNKTLALTESMNMDI